MVIIQDIIGNPLLHSLVLSRLSQKDISSCCLVSKSFLTTFGPLLWRNITVAPYNHAALLHSDSPPRFDQYFRNMIVDPKVPFKLPLNGYSNLQHLEYTYQGGNAQSVKNLSLTLHKLVLLKELRVRNVPFLKELLHGQAKVGAREHPSLETLHIDFFGSMDSGAMLHFLHCYGNLRELKISFVQGNDLDPPSLKDLFQRAQDGAVASIRDLELPFSGVPKQVSTFEPFLKRYPRLKRLQLKLERVNNVEAHMLASSLLKLCLDLRTLDMTDSGFNVDMIKSVLQGRQDLLSVAYTVPRAHDHIMESMIPLAYQNLGALELHAGKMLSLQDLFTIAETCQALHKLHLGVLMQATDASDGSLASLDSKPWICSGLQGLKLDFDWLSHGESFKMAVMASILKRLHGQIGAMINLIKLEIKGPRFSWHDIAVLDRSYLLQLAGLENLVEIVIGSWASFLVTQDRESEFKDEDILWMVEHWPRLKSISAKYYGLHSPALRSKLPEGRQDLELVTLSRF